MAGFFVEEKEQTMIYHSVENRCAVDITELKIDENIAHQVLKKLGFDFFEYDPVVVAKSCNGASQYRRGAKPCEAPKTVDCSSFVKWVYGQGGIWLPRYTVQQRHLGVRVSLTELAAGDVVFRKGFRNYFDTDPNDGVGHVGLFTGNDSVIHAANKKIGVVESTLGDFLSSQENFRGAVRLIYSTTWFLQIPREYPLETSDDLRWIILQQI